MKSDISRQTFNSNKHYKQVIMQQGRVQLDADWNEQQDILLHRINTQTGGTIGRGDVSADSNGFEVTLTPDGKDLVIAPGYIYVDGILCELEQEIAFPFQFNKSGQIVVSRQDVDDSPFKTNGWVELLLVNEDEQHEKRLGLLKITNVNDKDQQAITLSIDAFDQKIPDPGDSALKIRPVMTYLTQPHYPQPDPRVGGLPTLDTHDNEDILLIYLDVWERQITAFDDPGIREVALGGVDTAQRSQVLWQVKIAREKIPSEESPPFKEKRPSEKLLEALKQDAGTLSQAGHDALERNLSRLLRVFTFTPPFNEWQAPLPPYTGRLNARLSKTDSADTGTYKGLENQLYHVEIHEGSNDVAGIPTFKWARNNASSLVAVKIIEGQVTVQGSGQGNLLGLTVGQYVELLDERTELLALPGHIAQIKQVNDITGILTLDPPPPENAKQDRLQLWNGYAPIYENTDKNIPKNSWIALEGGVEIQFTLEGNQTYRSGDYWLIPARPAKGKIEWPHKTPQPPAGVQHHYTRLACQLNTDRIRLPLLDCRRRFFPLAADALHILDINWQNDKRYEEEDGHRLLREGLRITLDSAPDQEYEKAMQAAMIVTVETALPGGGAGIFVINGILKIDGNVITWHWGRKQKQGFSKFFAEFDEWVSDLFDRREHLQRVRITLKGHLIWHTANGRRIYLDGQAFGMPGTETSGHRPLPGEAAGKHIDLQFPSGAGRPASDFESWFYMEE